jgi:hypothetical protein
VGAPGAELVEEYEAAVFVSAAAQVSNDGFRPLSALRAHTKVH